jgi:hypothetical protein
MPLFNAPTGDIRSWHSREHNKLARSTAFISTVCMANSLNAIKVKRSFTFGRD